MKDNKDRIVQKLIDGINQGAFVDPVPDKKFEEALSSIERPKEVSRVRFGYQVELMNKPCFDFVEVPEGAPPGEVDVAIKAAAARKIGLNVWVEDEHQEPDLFLDDEFKFFEEDEWAVLRLHDFIPVDATKHTGFNLPQIDQTVLMQTADGRKFEGCLVDGAGVPGEGLYFCRWDGPCSLEELKGDDRPVLWREIEGAPTFNEKQAVT